VTDKKNNIVDLQKFRANERMREQIKTLDEMADYAYEHYSKTEQKGYENFKKLLKTLDKKYAPKE